MKQILVLLAVMSVISACGVKGDPLPVDDAQVDEVGRVGDEP